MHASGAVVPPLSRGHGESFLAMAGARFTGPGRSVLDEPESALSFSRSLVLLSDLTDLAASGSARVLLATHSPVLDALPEARLLEVGSWGFRGRCSEDLERVVQWRAVLDSPERVRRAVRQP